MASKFTNIKVFQDTLKRIASDEDLTAAVIQSKKRTSIYYADQYPLFEDGESQNTEIAVTRDRSFQAAMRLKSEDPEVKVVVLNFANAFTPGGGVTIGSNAQEEGLCRCSTLYPVLNRKYLKENYYGYHKKIGDLKATDAVIYSQDIIIFKTDKNTPKKMSRQDWVKVDVMTVAAPDLRKISMGDAELFECHVKRAIHILTVAASPKADILVLGAFGGGAFRNDPEVVAKAYKTALEKFPKVFKKIEFAIDCSDEEQKNYHTFKDMLA